MLNALLLTAAVSLQNSAKSQNSAPNVAELVRAAIVAIVAAQEGDEWPYEGVYRVRGEIPVGYRVGGTAIVAGALLEAADPADAKASAAFSRGVDSVLRNLDHPLMQPSRRDAYDVRVWGQAYALAFLCQVRDSKREVARAGEIDAWIRKLVQTLATEELEGGGWNYATRAVHASFVTAPVTQALLRARAQGETVPRETFDRALDALLASRVASGAFAYSGLAPTGKSLGVRVAMPGSIARSPICETTLNLLGGGGSADAIAASLDAFHEHWNELEARRKKSGTHAGPYQIAPYYVYYGHRYAGQAIEMLAASDRPKQRARLLDALMRTRDPDGTWNDREFPRSRSVCSALVVLALLGEKASMPPRLSPIESRPASRSSAAEVSATSPAGASKAGVAESDAPRLSPVGSPESSPASRPVSTQP